MIAPEYFNNHIAVEGEIVVKRVPNDTGSVVVWNSATKKLSIRTHAEIVSDLNLATVNTNQLITGIKSFVTSGGNYAPFNNTLQIYADDGSLPSMTYSKGGSHVGQIMFNSDGFYFKNGDNNAFYNVKAGGFEKSNSDNNHVLLGGGGHKDVSDFASSADLTNLVTKNTEQTITADKVFKKITTTDWVIPKFLAFPDASGALPNYIGFYMWNSQWQVNWRDSSNAYAYPLLDIDGISKNATFYGNTVSPKFFTPGGNSDQWNQAYSSLGNYLTLNTEQDVSAGKNYYVSTPFKFKNSSYKSWVFHKPVSNNLIFAPSLSNNAEDWDWSNQITFNDSGTVNSNGFIKNGSSNDYVLTGGGGHKLLSELSLNKVGSRNLILDSKNYHFSGSDAARSDNSVLGEITITDGSGFWNAYSNRLLAEYTPGSKLLYQIEIKHNNSTPIDMTFYFYNDGDSQIFNQIIPPNVWTKVTRLSSPNYTTNVLMGFGATNTDAGTKIYYRNKQVEEGHLPSTYRPAHEDFALNSQLNNYWEKNTVAGYTGINASTPFSVLNNGQAQKVYTGGLLVSDAYQDEDSVPGIGIYSKGDIKTGANFTGRAFYSPVLNGSQVFHAGNTDTIYFGNPQVSSVYIESGNSDLWHNRAGNVGKIWDAHNFNPNLKHSIDLDYGIYNGSDTRANKSWFDYSWAGLANTAGSVINFSGLHSDYSVELFGEYYSDRFGIRSHNGDANIWNSPKWLWHSGNFNPASKANAFENATAIGFGAGLSSNAPYFIHATDGYVELAKASQLNFKVNAWENASGIGFSAGLYPTDDGSLYPYIYHDSSGGNTPYIPLATQGFVNSGLNNKDGAWIQSNRDFPDGTLIRTNIDYSQWGGAAFMLEIKANMYGGSTPMDSKIVGYIYGDTIINVDGYSTSHQLKQVTALNLNGELCFWFPSMGYWQGFTVKVTDVTSGWRFTVNRAYSIENITDPGGTKRVNIPIKIIATRDWVNGQVSDFVTLHTPQTIIHEKTFASGLAIAGGQSILLKGYSDIAHRVQWFPDDSDGFAVSSAFSVKPYNDLSVSWFTANSGGAYSNGNRIWDAGNLIPVKLDGGKSSIFLNDIGINNLNELQQTGFFKGSNLINAPLNSPDWFFLTCEYHYTGWMSQTATSYGTGAVQGSRTFKRSWLSGTTWTDWYEVITTLTFNPDNYQPIGSYVTTNTVQGINAQKTFRNTLRVVGANVNSNTTKFIIGNEAASSWWALSAGDNNWTEDNLYMGTWNPNTNAWSPKISISNSGVIGTTNNNGTSENWKQAYDHMLPNQNWGGAPGITNRMTVGELAWRNYGNGHTVFDISNGITPWGVNKSNKDADVAWSESYPTLVGGNGFNTYGVRVDSARNADNLGNISAGSYVTQPNLNTQLSNYATLNGIQTFTNTNTFLQSPVIPDGTLGAHAVNKNQIELSTGYEGEGGQALKINGNNSVTLTNFFVTSRDGSRNPNDIAPNLTPRRVRFDFAAANSAGLGGSGNYAGIMTYSPWDGTTGSTGDSSYQLAFANQTGINGSGVPMLKIRKGIDGNWSTSWYKFWTQADFTITNIQQWNDAFQNGLRLNQDFTVFTGNEVMITDNYFANESGLIDTSYKNAIACKVNEYYKFGSNIHGWEGINYHYEKQTVGIGGEADSDNKVRVEGCVKATANFKSKEESPNSIFIPDGSIADLKDEIVNEKYAIRLDPHEYELDPSGYLDIDDRNRLIHVIGEQAKMTVNFKEIYSKQQIVIYNFDQKGYPMSVLIKDKLVYNIEPGCFLRLYVTKSLRVIAERQMPSEFIW
ncbi:pyocin knob domain-containing protein [uncultured Chryseobacterium sp.]|uniref:pyocin knob domain-containing protein n=1 Tax=uncultured Chryseobacterium sp. TaxID=259322 RepID=UPI0025D95484|nr:pyocin knob domain-containing protein [uncultured Chryseobacterium sp.]